MIRNEDCNPFSSNIKDCEQTSDCPSEPHLLDDIKLEVVKEEIGEIPEVIRKDQDDLTLNIEVIEERYFAVEEWATEVDIKKETDSNSGKVDEIDIPDLIKYEDIPIKEETEKNNSEIKEYEIDKELDLIKHEEIDISKEEETDECEEKEKESPSSKVKRQSAKGNMLTPEYKIWAYKVYVHYYNQHLTKTSSIQLASLKTGLSTRFLWRLINQINLNGHPDARRERKQRLSILEKLDDNQKDVIKKIIQSFRDRNEDPTVQKILEEIKANGTLPPIGRTTLYTILNTCDWVSWSGTRKRKK